MLKLGKPKKRSAAKAKKQGAPIKSKYKPGSKFVCKDCGETHTLIPCDNPSPKYDSWLFYYCENRLKLGLFQGWVFI